MSEVDFKHVSEIEHAMGLQGSYWFSHDTMKAFKTSIWFGGHVYGGKYFVTRERSRRREWGWYLIRKVSLNNDGMYEIDTIYSHSASSVNMGFMSAKEAERVINRLIKDEEQEGVNA